MTFTYLASPYSHKDPAVREQRFRDAVRHAARLMTAGGAIFCPIAHSHPIDQLFDGPQPHGFWMAQDLPLLAAAAKLKVLMLPGWENSRGLAEEVAFAKRRGIPVEWVDAD